ncbi:uncharacterized mitochondrial protein AtMg00860-like [Tripterygium wilfordii]|uniref:uncharacterized mitochondrial protein AtMg00860-like n=1 Tax=Tripterygium wilfordii TaxID=458696 RepID=UPI0018F81EAA|nr:uncharacterized mitochondrial protein AtMg00860-like [Tripterygium wilfordii]
MKQNHLARDHIIMGLYKKDEIEKAVHEVLQAGFIRNSHSSLSSPILLVKKKKKEHGTKMCLWTETIEYLGHVVFGKGVSTNPSKLKAILEWLVPTNVNELKGFLGLTTYYRKFVPNYGKICQQLYGLTKKEDFVCSSSATQVFEKLKQVMASPHVMHPD